MNARSSAYRTFCIYWSALALVVISLGQEREDVLIRVSAHEGVGQGKSKCSKWFFTNGFIGFPSEGLGEFLDDKSKDKRDGGRLIYYHVRLGLFIKPQMLVAQLWHAEWWLDVENDESHALYGGRSFFCPLSSSVPHPLPSNTPSAQQQPLCLPVSCIRLASFLLLWFFSDHQDAGLKGSSVKNQPATTASCTRQPPEELGFKALLSPGFDAAVTKCECVWFGWWNYQTIPL